MAKPACIAACLTAVLTLSASCERQDSAAAPAPTPPNNILVSIDSLRADHVGCYGYGQPTSPTIDRLAAEGVRFVNAVSTSSWTLPAHAAMFTGMYNSAHGIVETGMRLADGHLTLAEQLSAGGYSTIGLFSGPHLHPTFGLAQGFNEYFNCTGSKPRSTIARSSSSCTCGTCTTTTFHPAATSRCSIPTIAEP